VQLRQLPLLLALDVAGEVLHGGLRRETLVFVGVGTRSFLLALFFLVFALVYPAGLGMGDVKLALLIGAALGYAVVSALLLGTLAAGVFGAILLFKEGSSARKRAIPLGPFLAAGAIVVLLFF